MFKVLAKEKIAVVAEDGQCGSENSGHAFKHENLRRSPCHNVMNSSSTSIRNLIIN